MAVTMTDITHLRKMSGAGMMDCKNALEEADNDYEKAMEIIRRKGQAVAAKRSDRDASEGCVLAAIGVDLAAIVALKCETDFVAKNTEFIALTQSILGAAIQNKPTSIAELLAAPLSDGRSVENHITDRIGVTGEKIELGFYEYLKGSDTMSYVHPGNKLATIVLFNQSIEYQISRDVAMQIAAMNPIAIAQEEIPRKVIETELEIARDKARQAGKPADVVERIALGALHKFYKESVLLQQDYIKDPKITVQQYLHRQSKTLTVSAFKRVSLNVE